MPASLTRRVDERLASAFAACGLPTDTAHAARAARPELADLQCNGAMALGKSLGRNPRDVAAMIAERLRDCPEFTDVGVAGPGFLNLRLSEGFLADCATAQAGSADLGIAPLDVGTVMLDFGGPNVAKPLHVGHLRAMVIGESLRRILQAQGVHTISDIHLGDWGLQMGMLICGIRRQWPELEPGTLPPLDMADLQRLYPEAAAACKADPRGWTKPAPRPRRCSPATRMRCRCGSRCARSRWPRSSATSPCWMRISTCCSARATCSR